MEDVKKSKAQENLERTCPTCGVLFHRPPSDPSKTCSIKCRRYTPEHIKKIRLNGAVQMAARSGEKHYKWKGGRVKSGCGYIYVQHKLHPRASKCGGYVFEHILVAEKTIGRPIREYEIVHHLNGIKTDNRPINLAVMLRSEHVRHHPRVRNEFGQFGGQSN